MLLGMENISCIRNKISYVILPINKEAITNSRLLKNDGLYWIYVRIQTQERIKPKRPT